MSGSHETKVQGARRTAYGVLRKVNGKDGKGAVNKARRRCKINAHHS